MDSNGSAPMSKSGQSGFTLIELVVVIVILGILSAFAVPRFIQVEEQARKSTVQALAGSVRSSAALAHSLWIANGSDDLDVTIEGQTVDIVFGYPSREHITRTLTDVDDAFSYDPVTGQFARRGAASPADCSVNYSPPASLNEGATIAIFEDCK